jgi:hypothetical protein
MIDPAGFFLTLPALSYLYVGVPWDCFFFSTNLWRIPSLLLSSCFLNFQKENKSGVLGEGGGMLWIFESFYKTGVFSLP